MTDDERAKWARGVGGASILGLTTWITLAAPTVSEGFKHALIAASGALMLVALYLWWPFVLALTRRLTTSTTFRTWIEIGSLVAIVAIAAISYNRINANHALELAGVNDRAAAAEKERDLRGEQNAVLQQRVDLLTAALTTSTGNSAAAQAVTDSVQLPLGPTSLATRTGVTPETYTTAAESLRAEHSLRELADTELGRPFGEMAIGTYSFAYPGHMTTGSQGFAQMPRQVLTYKDAESEIQRREDGEILVVVFAEESALPLVANLDGRQDRTIDTFARPSGRRTTRIELPVSRIQRVTSRPTAPAAIEYTIR